MSKSPFEDVFEGILGGKFGGRQNPVEELRDAGNRVRGEAYRNLFDELRGEVAEIVNALGAIDEHVAIRRAVGLYLQVVRHVRAGGRVLFEDDDGKQRALRLPLR